MKTDPSGLSSLEGVIQQADLIQYQTGAVVSRTLVNKPGGTVTAFAFDQGEGLSEHTAPYDALVLMIEGEAEITISKVAYRVNAKQMLRLPAGQPHTVKAITQFKIENARLVYRAHVKTENVVGQAYLEMWCVFPGLGEYFSRSLQNPVHGTVDWSTLETPFFLQKGQKPELIKLNVVIDGQGTAWIDDIALLKGSLE
jgi:quercetin dioxygenase-like cupin family protein